MANKCNTTAEYLEQNNKHWKDVRAVYEYVRFKDLKIVDQQLNAAAGRCYGIHEMIRLAVNESAESEAARAVYEIALHRIISSDKSRPDEFGGQFALRCVLAAVQGDNNRMDQQLIDDLRKKGVDDFSLAWFWVTNSSHYGRRYEEISEWSAVPVSEENILQPTSLFKLPENLKDKNVFNQIILGLPDDKMLELLQQYSKAEVLYDKLVWNVAPLQALLARDKPKLLSRFIDSLPENDELARWAVEWPYINAVTEEFDGQCISYCELHGLCYPLIVLDGLRGGKYTKLAIESCSGTSDQDVLRNARFILTYLAENNPQMMLEKLPYVATCNSQVAIPDETWGKYYLIVLGLWENGGKKVCLQVPVRVASKFYEQIIKSDASKDHVNEWSKGIWHFCVGTGYHQDKVREPILAHDPQVVEEQMWLTLQEKNKGARANSVTGLMTDGIDNVVSKAKKLLDGKIDARLGAIELLITVGDDEAVSILKGMLKSDQSAKVSKAVIAGLEKLGKAPGIDDSDDDYSDPDVLSKIESAKITALPKTTQVWIDIAGLPELLTKDCEPLTEKAICHLIAAQAKHKTIKAAPDSIPVLKLIDREKSADFALALFQQWMRSECNAADKWVMTLTGILGDRRVLPVLSDPIAGWVQASRHKLAEWSALAIALVPVDESLMLLDLLANRYRSKYRNIGKACRVALEQAAAAQDISVDELADMIVPTLEFDTEYQRSLPDTDVRAVLQPDFKLKFFNPASEKETASMPKTLPESAKAELKTVKTLIRQTIKGQTARLEQDLVRQRSWQTKRWQELFEVNPFLQSYASRLVWATLDKKGQHNKLFRRYPNGLLANAAGDLIDLDKSDIEVVIVHPLNLDDQTLSDWQAHLSRMKIKPPFAQLDRPVEKPDPKQANRKQIAFTDGHRMASGTFRSRAEKLGWVKGSIVDGGGITSYYKTYPGALISIFLMVEDTYIGQDPADPLLLGDALFVKAESIKVGSYTYDEPKNTDDPRVVAFGDVPEVVYSESISDLKTIVASKNG